MCYDKINEKISRILFEWVVSFTATCNTDNSEPRRYLMATIVMIKQGIEQLDAGSFQILCDAYLSKIGYPNIVSLGTKAGTQKTTPGTPDTYFYPSDGKYVFTEYTTQQSGLFAKIQSDIEKCLDVSSTDIPHDQISEIVYCHTSSNLSPCQDHELRMQCEDKGIKLTLIGIDQLAEDINSTYHGLAKEHLHLSIDTEQIQTEDEFVRQYNANSLAAPLDTPFLFREKELSDIDEAFQRVDVVILSGAAGTGKTRLALQYAQNHALKHKEQLYCIHDRALPLYEDLQLSIDKPGQYFLFVDDANQLSMLHLVIEYVNKQNVGYNVKVLITVRDYAIQKVTDDICGIAYYESLLIKTLSDNEIKKMLKETLGILNSDYLDRIAHIAEGNARIAMLAGKIMRETNRLNADDVSQLYDEYYGPALKEADLNLDDGLFISAGVIAFLNAIHLEHIDSLIPVLESKNISKEEFVKNIYKLHDREIVDVCHDKAVRFSEQCFANFILKYVFYDKKLLRLANIIESCFDSHKERTIFSINTLAEVFKNTDLHQYIEDEIRFLWKKLAKEKSPIFFDFVKVFSQINPTGTLLLLQEKIESENTVLIPADEIDIVKEKKYKSENDDILFLLGRFADSLDLDTALDLYFQYYQKRPDKFIQFYHTAIVHYSIHSNSSQYQHNTQLSFIKKLCENSHNGKDELITTLFLEIVGEFLRLQFSPTESGRNNNSIVFYKISLTLTENVKEYRAIIWTFLLEVSQNPKYTHKVKKILNNYGRVIDEYSIEVVKSDVPYIIKLLNTAFPPSGLSNCLLACHMTRMLDVAKIETYEIKSELERYMKNEKLGIYHMLQGPKREKGFSIEERRLEKAKNIQTYISTAPNRIEAFKKILDICYEIHSTEKNRKYEIFNGLEIAFQELENKKDDYITSVKCYLELDTPLGLHSINIVKNLFSMMPADEVFTLIVSKEYTQKNTWLYAYYHELPQQYIDVKILEGLYAFLGDTSDISIKLSPNRDVNFLEKYNVVDPNAFIHGCRIILSKMSYSPFMVNLYFGLMFTTPRDTIEKFSNDLNLLEEIYIKTILYNKEEDYDGSFLREIYLVSPSIIDKYTEKVLKTRNDYSIDDNYERNQTFFDLENSDKIYDMIIDELIKSSPLPTSDVPSYIKSLVIPKQHDDVRLSRQDAWIKHYICIYSDDNLKMQILFKAVIELEIEHRLEYIKLFLEYNEEFDIFNTIPLIPETYGWGDSAVPLYFSWIDFLQKLLPSLTGLKFIKHKNRVENEIETLRKKIENEEIYNILEG